MPNQPYIDITGTTSYRKATGSGTLADPYIPSFVQENVVSLAYQASATTTRAANSTPYTTNDVYGGVFELQNIGTANGNIIITSVDIIFNIDALPSGMGLFAVYLYSSAPASAITDNNAFSIANIDRANILNPAGIELTAVLARGGGSVIAQVNKIDQQVRLANSTSLWGYLVTANAFTPANASETCTIRVRAELP
ncbi:MAG: hypothetical protein ACKPE3_01155 [Sphaerospermopsis kisseleviana]